MPLELDLLAVRRGTVTAPAGCGKTQLIADSLRTRQLSKPVLILTHTNAGVCTLRLRLQRSGVPSAAYRLATIDGFAMRLVGMFPARSGITPDVLKLLDPKKDYPAIRDAAFKLVNEGHLNDVLPATYAHLIVDEYQDCLLLQHAIVDWAAAVLPTCVLGDPMQAIFGFAGNTLVDWQANVWAQFPAIGELQVPWRWRNAGTEAFGHWLLDVRRILAAGGKIDLRNAPVEVSWIPLAAGAPQQQQQRLVAARTRAVTPDGSVLVIGDSRNTQGRRQIASQVPGATAVEAVDLADLTDFGRYFEPHAPDALSRLVNFASSVMTNVGAAELLRRIGSLRQGTARKAPTLAEAAVLTFLNSPTLAAAADALKQISEQAEVRIYRPEVLRGCLSSMRAASDGSCTLHAATVREREKNRHLARPLSRRAVGSTLLLKGLEAEVAVLLQPEEMDAKHLYVALTRGAHRVVVCSSTPILPA